MQQSGAGGRHGEAAPAARGAVEHGPHQADADTGSTREDFILFFTALAEFLASPVGRSITGLALDPSDDEAPLEQARDQFWTIRLTRASILVRRGIDRHELDPGTEPELILEALAGPLHLHILLRNRRADDNYISRLVDLTFDGARPR